MRSMMRVRSGFCLLLLLSLTSCAALPDRYAFWRNNRPLPAGVKKPNLGDVPVPPDVDATRADISTMRQQMERDRVASYDDAGVTNTDITFSQLAPVMSETTSPLATMTNATDDRAVAQGNSAVLYNYGNGTSVSPYTYGDGAVSVNPVGSLAPQDSTADPSVSIDWSALGGTQPVASESTTALAPGGNSLYFKFGSARIGKGDRAALERLARQAQGGVTVAGYASQRTGLANPVAAKDVNLRMSAQRASAVMRELARLGVPAQNIKIIANGDSMAGTQDVQDRRVDLHIN